MLKKAGFDVDVGAWKRNSWFHRLQKAAAEINGWINLVYLCAAYGQHGDVAKAATARDALLKLQPGYTIAWYRSTYRASPPRFFELIDRHLAPGLSKAGIPEK